MKFKVGDLVEFTDKEDSWVVTYFGEMGVVVDTGFELRACVDQVRKYQFVILHYPVGKNYTIRSFESSAWSKLKVVANG